MAAAGGVLAVGRRLRARRRGSRRSGARSPGVLSGNTVQVPVDVPVNVCGNTVNVVGLLNPAVGNSCAQRRRPARPRRSSAPPGRLTRAGGHGATTAARRRGGPATTSRRRSDVPVNVCGQQRRDVGGGGNRGPRTTTAPIGVRLGDSGRPAPPGASRRARIRTSREQPEKPSEHPDDPTDRAPQPVGRGGREPCRHPTASRRAARGDRRSVAAATIPAAAGMLLAGTVPYRRSRAARHRRPIGPSHGPSVCRTTGSSGLSERAARSVGARCRVLGRARLTAAARAAELCGTGPARTPRARPPPWRRPGLRQRFTRWRAAGG